MKPKILLPLLLNVLVVYGALATTWTVCAEGCDFSSIQEAVYSELTRGGDVILVKAGEYSSESLWIGKNLEIISETHLGATFSTWNIIIQSGAIVKFAGFRIYGVNLFVDGSLTLEDNELYIAIVSYGGGGFRMVNNTFIHPHPPLLYYAIKLPNYYDIVIENNTIVANGGIMLGGGVVVKNNTIYTPDGCILFPTAPDGTPMKNITIMDNNIETQCIHLYDSQDVNISNNVIRGNIYSGYDWWGNYVPSKNISVSGNHIEGNISLRGSSVIVSNNEIVGDLRFDGVANLFIQYNNISGRVSIAGIDASKEKIMKNVKMDYNKIVCEADSCIVVLNAMNVSISQNSIEAPNICVYLGSGVYQDTQYYIKEIEFTKNTFLKCTYGLTSQHNALLCIENTTLYLNNFINVQTPFLTGSECSHKDNHLNTTTLCKYKYKGKEYSSRLGNYYDSFECQDKDKNGVCDTRRDFDKNNIDYYPLADRFENYDCAPISSPPTPTPIPTPTPTPPIPPYHGEDQSKYGYLIAAILIALAIMYIFGYKHKK